MALAVVDYIDLLEFTNELGFPKETKVKLEPQGIGYQHYDKWIRDNVKWVNHLEFDPIKHVRITESAQLVGEIPDFWENRCQKFLEGTDESNSFKEITVSNDHSVLTHVNRQAIQIAVSTAALRYKIDYMQDDDGVVSTDSFLNVAIFNNPEDTSLSYSSDVKVEQLWTTSTECIDQDGKSVYSLFMRAYSHDPKVENSYPWLLVGELTDEEYAEWAVNNVKPESTMKSFNSNTLKQLA